MQLFKLLKSKLWYPCRIVDTCKNPKSYVENNFGKSVIRNSIYLKRSENVNLNDDHNNEEICDDSSSNDNSYPNDNLDNGHLS